MKGSTDFGTHCPVTQQVRYGQESSHDISGAAEVQVQAQVKRSRKLPLLE